jgi:hypothetical protein
MPDRASNPLRRFFFATRTDDAVEPGARWSSAALAAGLVLGCGWMLWRKTDLRWDWETVGGYWRLFLSGWAYRYRFPPCQPPYHLPSSAPQQRLQARAGGGGGRARGRAVAEPWPNRDRTVTKPWPNRDQTVTIFGHSYLAVSKRSRSGTCMGKVYRNF